MLSMAMPWVSGLDASCDRAASEDRAKSAHAAVRAKVRYGKQEVGLIRLRSKEAAAEHSQSELDGGQLKRLARLGNLLVGLRGSGKGTAGPGSSRSTTKRARFSRQRALQR